MANCVDVNGVRMWYDDRGDGDPLVLLHGGLTDSRDFPATSTHWSTGFGYCSPNVGVTGIPPTWKGRSRSR